MIVFLIPNLSKADAVPTALRAVQTLIQAGARVILPVEVKESFVSDYDVDFFERAKAYELCDVIVTVGGDGTMLHAASQSLGYKKPLLGVNIGRLGFLATVEADEIDKLSRLVSGDYILDQRALLSVSVQGKNRFHQTALNDVVIGKSMLSKTIEVQIFCDDILVNHFQGDGVVIATPTGSTAYSLPAGGPVLDAHISGIVVTPVCAHSLYSAPLVLSAERKLRVTLSAPQEPHTALLSCDGRNPEIISCHDVIEVDLSDKFVSLISFNEADQFNAIDTKLKGR